MGFFDDILDFVAPVTDIFTGGMGTAIKTGLDFAGGLMRNSSASDEAATNRQFQADMSSTAHQREVEDLIKAGLNPILSANHGASTPAGSMAAVENPFSSGVSNWNASEKINIDKAAVESSIKLNSALAQKATQDAETAASAAHLNEANADAVRYTVLKNEAETNLLHVNTAKGAYDLDNIMPLQPALLKSQTLQNASQAQLNSASAAKVLSDKIINDIEIDATKDVKGMLKGSEGVGKALDVIYKLRGLVPTKR